MIDIVFSKKSFQNTHVVCVFFTFNIVVMSECPSHRFFLINTVSGARRAVTCRTYSCPDCGPKKIQKLYSAIKSYLETQKEIRFWTFTMKSEIFQDPQEHLQKLNSAWRYFITYIRRTKALSEYQRKFAFIKIPELHKSGYYHFHVFIDRFINREVVQKIWESVVQEKLHRQDHCAFSFVELLPNARIAAKYVTKYVLKLVRENSAIKRRYSKSNSIKLFKKIESSGNWILYDSYKADYYGLIDEFVFRFQNGSPLPLLDIEVCKFTSPIQLNVFESPP